ncbi:xylose isomerase-like TIM barrel [Clostridium tepidiprofundi DSM 19306]|uniref:Xylose isomerase-like TIM barrel n=1 Tax=Clostridium tepidiprofundi DSM 19306 TaxID=1121338 RepID=A0A151B2S4_9CLOT|nr:TIM barrel protein [Clostridium tepidiprofundi]KYH33967.1 xylose isomerase-like TIM barrel [Clostridium tepidiprofundi DSM 19306]
MKKIVSISDIYLISDRKDVLKIIREQGFDGVFIYASDVKGESSIQEIYANNLEIEMVHLSNGKEINEIWKNGCEGDEVVQKIIGEIKKMNELGLKKGVLHTTSSFFPPDVSKIAVDRMKRIVNVCESMEFKLAIENLKSQRHIDYLLQQIESDMFGFCFDSGHANAFTKNLELFPWELYGDRIMSLHLHDNNGEKDQHLIPGKGNIHWSWLIHKLFSLKADLNLTLEVEYKGKEYAYGKVSDSDFYAMAYQSLLTLEKFITIT